MGLHRDIYWIGRQWTVTGFGIQACDQKNYAKFDIEAGRLWEPGALDKVRDQGWLNIVDFEKALHVARQRYPQPPSAPASPEASVLGLIDTVLREPWCKDSSRRYPSLQDPSLQDLSLEDPSRQDPSRQEPGAKATAVEPRKLAAAVKFDMRVSRWPAKFVPSWRIRISR